MQKLGPLLLGLLLIVQLVNALPAPEDNAVSKETGGREKLLLKAQEIYVDFFSFATEKYRGMFQNILDNLKSAAESDSKAKEKLEPLQDYVDKTENLKDKTKEELHELFEESTKIARSFSNDDDDDGEDKIDAKITEYLTESDESMKVKFDILMRYVSSMNQFGNNVRKYLNSLSEDERQENMKIVSWYEDWRHEHDFEKKTEILGKFFDTFEPTDEVRDKLFLEIIAFYLFYLDDIVSKRSEIYKDVAEAIEKEIENPNEAIQFQLNIFKGFHDRAGKVHDLDGMDLAVELTRLYAANREIIDKYNESNLSEDEQKVAKIVEKERNPIEESKEILMTYGFIDTVIEEVEDYLSSLNDSELEAEKKLATWFEEVQDETDFEKKTSKTLSILENLKKE